MDRRKSAGVTRLSVRDLDVLERAIARGTRVAIWTGRRVELVLPLRLETSGRVEILSGRRPSTGEPITIALDRVDRIEESR